MCGAPRLLAASSLCNWVAAIFTSSYFRSCDLLPVGVLGVVDVGSPQRLSPFNLSLIYESSVGKRLMEIEREHRKHTPTHSVRKDP